MDDAIDRLITKLRKRPPGADVEQDKLDELIAALAGWPVASRLIELMQDPHATIRFAAVTACRTREGLATDGPLTRGLLTASRDADWSVRRNAAYALSRILDPAAEARLLEVVRTDEVPGTRVAAIEGVIEAVERGVERLLPVIVERFRQDTSYDVRIRCARALRLAPPEQAWPLLLEALKQDTDADVRHTAATAAEGILARLAVAESPVRLVVPLPLLFPALDMLRQLGTQRELFVPQLLAYLEAAAVGQVDPEALASFGTDLTALAEAGGLPRGHLLDEACEEVLRGLLAPRPRPVVLVGPSGSGKTALVSELVHRLRARAEEPWRVLRFTAQDALAGTKYLGEWDTRVLELIQLVRRPRRVVLYVPNFEDLTRAGVWSKSDQNVASTLAPYLEDGSLVCLAEATPEGWEKANEFRSFRRLFHVVRLEEQDAATTLRILHAAREEAGIPLGDDLLEQLAQAASHYLTSIARPGNAVGLLRALVADPRFAEGQTVPTFRHVLETISATTGIPVDLLDDEVPLDLLAAREFFEERVMGQPEAVAAIIDLVTLIKAGLTDSRRPLGVLLFVGPTGVGKTELARALAEFVFGNADRLLRFDMSEYAAYEGFQRLIGDSGRGVRGMLTEAVRQQPFSVVLLDEIEKAHPNVFDLCLQLFDAGRLTDGWGRTVNFLNTILIMTSNVGSQPLGEARLGFGRPPVAAGDEPVSGATLRTLAGTFRPEFLGRIDRILRFRPLSPEVAERIARREVGQVLQRSGIQRRELGVDVGPEVFSRLLQEGYSPEFGARPLKRTVDRLVLLPVARAIAIGRLPPGALLRLVVRGERIVAEQAREAEPRETRIRRIERRAEPGPAGPEPLREEQARLNGLLREVEAWTGPLAEQKSLLLETTRQPGFWQAAEEARGTLDQVHRVDRLLGAQQDLTLAVENLEERLEHWLATNAGASRSAEEGDRVQLREQQQELAFQLEQLAALSRGRGPEDLGDALLCLTRVSQRGEPQDSVARLVNMYLAWAERRHLHGEVLAEWLVESPRQEQLFLQISGIGAYALLAGEQGLHQFVLRWKAGESGNRHGPAQHHREVVRVDVLLFAERTARPKGETRVHQTEGRAVPVRYVTPPAVELTLFHQPTGLSLQGRLAGPREEAIPLFERILQAQVGALSRLADQTQLGPQLVRRYELGHGQRIRDVRTGITTTRLERVLRGGHLDPFLMGPERAGTRNEA